MERNEFTILLDLQDFFSDDKCRAKVLVSPNYKNVSDIENKIAEIFGISNFHLLSDGHYLPSSEDISLVKNGETLRVRPTALSSKTLLSEIYYTNLSNRISKHKNVTRNIQNGDASSECHEKQILFSSTPNNNANSSNSKTYQEEQNHDYQVIESCHSRKKKKKKKEILVAEEENIEQKTFRKRKREVLSDDNNTGNSQLIEEMKETCEFHGKEDNYTKNINTKSKKKRQKKITTPNESIEMASSENIMNDSKTNEKSDEKKRELKENQSNVNIIKIDIIKQSNTFDNSTGAEEINDNLTAESLDIPIEICETNIENNDMEIGKYEPKPLQHKRANNGTSWSTSPLLKTTNSVKILRVPTTKIELDDSRFVYSRREAFLIDKEDEEKKNATPLEQNDVLVEDNNKKPVEPDEKEKIACAEIPLPSQDDRTSSICVLELDENEDTQKSKARELWRKKLIEKTVDNRKEWSSNSNESLNDSIMDIVPNQVKICDKSNISLKEYKHVENSHTEGNHLTSDPFQAQEKMETMTEDTLTSDQNEHDSSLSHSTLADFPDLSQFQQTKRKRKRKHKKKTKDKHASFTEEPKNIPYARQSLVSGKPRIHIKFDDIQNDAPELNENLELEAHQDPASETKTQGETSISLDVSEGKETIPLVEPTKSNEVKTNSLGRQEFLSTKDIEDVENALTELKNELLKAVDAISEIRSLDND